MAQKESTVQFSKLYAILYQPLLLELVNDIGQLCTGWQADIIQPIVTGSGDAELR